MPHRALRGRRPRTPVIPRSLAIRAAGTVVAAAAVFAAPSAAQAAAAALFSRRAIGAHPSGEQRSPGRQRA